MNAPHMAHLHEPAYLVDDAPQGSPEWHALRRGIPTASMFHVCRQWTGGLDARQAKYVEAVKRGLSKAECLEAGGYKAAPTAQAVAIALEGGTPGDHSDTAKRYARQLALESIGAEMPDQFETFYMRRGHDLEPEIRKLHALDLSMSAEDSHLEVIPAGFVRTPDLRFGASADSLVGQDGGAEYKAFLDPDKVWGILVENDWSELMDQVQGGMWITGRKWWDMCLYCPGLKSAGLAFTRQRVMRDDNYIEALESDLLRFYKLLDYYKEQLQPLLRRL